MALEVRTDFPGGNACAIETTALPERDVVRFAADPRGGTEALWFWVRIEGCAGRPVELVLTNADTCLGFGGGGRTTRPVYRYARGDWERVADTELRTLPDGRHEAVWVVNPRASSFDFAFCYPYLPDDLAHTLAECSGYWHEDAIGVTQKGRPLTRLANAFGNEPAQAAGIYVIARQHAGETPGSWVLDGLLRHAQRALDPAQILLWAVPFAHLDGVVEGDYGKDPFPHDLNRAWTRPPMRHEVLVVQRDLARWARRCHPAVVLDLHGPGAAETEGAYFHLPRPSRPAEHVEATRAAALYIRERLPAEFIREQPDVQATYASRWSDGGILGSHVWDTLAIPSLCLETPYAQIRGKELSREDYRGLGAALLEALVAYTQT